MAKIKSKYWEIACLAVQTEEVVFPEPLTREEAVEAYLEEEFEEIRESDRTTTETILSTRCLTE